MKYVLLLAWPIGWVAHCNGRESGYFGNPAAYIHWFADILSGDVVVDYPGLVRAKPKSVTLKESWSASFTLGAHNVYKFEPTVALLASVHIPLDDIGCLPEAAWEDIGRAATAKDHQGRIGILALVSNEREQSRAGGRGAPVVSVDDAVHAQDEKWTAFALNLPVNSLAEDFKSSSDARAGRDAEIRISTSASRGDLRPIRTTAILSTEVETFVFLSDVLRGQADRQLKNAVATRIAAQLRKPEAERGEHRLLLRTEIRADLAANRSTPITLKYFGIEWPYLSDGSDVRLSVVKSLNADSDASIREEQDEHRFTYNSGTGKIEIGGIQIPWAMQSSTADGAQLFEIILRFTNVEMQAAMANLKTEMVLEFDGSILDIRPVLSDWSGEIVATTGRDSKIPMKQMSSANIQMTINLREVFENQYYAFGYRMRLRGVDINSERIQYVKQILAERTMTLRAEGLGRDLESGNRVGQREWLLMADRTVQGDKLLLTSLVQCETRQVALIEGSETDRVHREAIGADTTIDVLGVLRGKREDLMNEVNAYVRDLRHQLSRFASRR